LGAEIMKLGMAGRCRTMRENFQEDGRMGAGAEVGLALGKLCEALGVIGASGEV